MKTHESKCGTLRLLVSTEFKAATQGNKTHQQSTHPIKKEPFRNRKPTRTVCTVSARAAFCTCTPCTRDGARLSSSSSLSCGTRASSVHRNRSACGRNAVYPARRSSLCPSCIGSLCAGCRSMGLSERAESAIMPEGVWNKGRTCASCTSCPCSLAVP